MKKTVLFFTLTLSLLADCKLNTGKETEAYDLYSEAGALYSSEEYSAAYKKLSESYDIYSESKDSLTVSYRCTHYIPGPYGVKIRTKEKHETLDFSRENLGKDIKKFLNPNPFIFVQLQNNKTIVSVHNSPKTARGQVSEQLPLEDFKVFIGDESIDFGTIAMNETSRNAIDKDFSLKTKIRTSEKFNFKLFPH